MQYNLTIPLLMDRCAIYNFVFSGNTVMYLPTTGPFTHSVYPFKICTNIAQFSF